MFFLMLDTGNFNLFSADAVGLYNGNIAALSTATDSVTPLLKLFRYDKLNRIKLMQTAGISTGEWGSPTDNFSTEYRYDYNGNILSLQRRNANAVLMHRINYTYNTKNNRLQGITATGINSSNYSYDAIGNLANDSGENVGVTWNAMNKVKTVVTPNSTLHFAYSPTGQRQIKKTGDKTEYYLHDATGNIMCVYELSGNYLTVKERTIYGSKRIGVYRQRIQLGYSGISAVVVIDPGSNLINILHPSPIFPPVGGRLYLQGSNRLQVIGDNRRIISNTTMPYSYKKGTEELKGFAPVMYSIPTFLDGTKTAGLRDYELTDHLSNVMAVISDRKLSVNTNNDTITDYYEPQVVSFTDYYPFGFPMAERSGNLVGYRFGFNGQEADNEVYGAKQSYTAEFWQYDTRLGRRWNVDPKGNAWISPYATFDNNPIVLADYSGEDGIVTIKGNTVTIKTKIYIYGSGATKEQAAQMQKNIMADWNKGWTYTDKRGKIYNVKFDVTVDVYNEKNPTQDPLIIPDSWNPFSRKNYVEVGSTPDDIARSYVKGGDEGKWRGYGSDPSSHEYGHIIGLDDKYTDKEGAIKGWEGNIMAEPAGQGQVEQKNIDAIMNQIFKRYEKAGNPDEFQTEINESNPSW